MRVYWSICHPNTYGVLIAIWHNGTILLIRNSYVRYYSLPGGFIYRKETAKQAAIRELIEETGLSLNDKILTQAFDIAHDWYRRSDHVKIFVTNLPEEQKIPWCPSPVRWRWTNFPLTAGPVPSGSPGRFP